MSDIHSPEVTCNPRTDLTEIELPPPSSAGLKIDCVELCSTKSLSLGKHQHFWGVG